jgi:hypothetical protein
MEGSAVEGLENLRRRDVGTGGKIISEEDASLVNDDVLSECLLCKLEGILVDDWEAREGGMDFDIKVSGWKGDIGRMAGIMGRPLSPSKDTFGSGVAIKESGVVPLDESFLRRQKDGLREIGFIDGNSCSFSFSLPSGDRRSPNESPLVRPRSNVLDIASSGESKVNF